VSFGSPEPLATHKSKRGKTDDRIADDVRERRGFTGRDGSPAPHGRRDLVSGRRCRRAVEGEAFVAPIVGSLIVVVAMALFTVIVFRTSRA
jgi:hypothetical protein